MPSRETSFTAPRTTVHVDRSTSPTCHRCSTPLRLHASIQTGACCCCRGRCFADVGYGCLACGALLPDETLRLCLRCQVATPITMGGAGKGKPAPPIVPTEDA